MGQVNRSPIDTTLIRSTVPREVTQIGDRLITAGHRAWIVGGIVRDLVRATLAGAQSVVPRGDWDLATDAHPEEVTRLFRRVVPTGLQHGTVTVMIGRSGFEVTTLRGETTYSDGRHPDAVYFVDDIVADLARRDFTVNAMAYDPMADELIDPYGGIDDLVAGRLRAVGEATERFAEDGLRALRAARFVATLEIELDEATERAIEPSLASYRRVSAERIREEWMKALRASKPSRAFEVMRRTGLLEVTSPELVALHGVAQNRYHAYDVWEHTMRCLDHCPPRPLVRLAGLLHDVAKPLVRAFSEKTNDYTFYEHERLGGDIADKLLRRLKFSNEERTRVTSLVRHHLVVYDDSWTDAGVRRWLRRVTPDLLDDVLDLSRADILAKGREVSDELSRIDALRARVDTVLTAGAALTVRDLAINGHDLMSVLDVKPGPAMGDALKQLLDEVTEDPSLNKRDTLLERARALLS